MWVDVCIELITVWRVSQHFPRLIKVSHPSFKNVLISVEVTLSNTADIQRLHRGGQIRRMKKKTNLMNDKRIRSVVAKYSCGNCTLIEFLCFLSHCWNDDTGSSTEEYEYELDDTRSPVTANSNTTASATVVTASDGLASCNVCLDASRVIIVTLVPCGHATFCQQCIDSHTLRNQFSLSYVSWCNIFYRPVLSFIPYICFPNMCFHRFNSYLCNCCIFRYLRFQHPSPMSLSAPVF